MYNRRTLGLIIALSGLLLTCCLCPLALNNLIFAATSGGSPSNIVSIYGRLFSSGSAYVILLQVSCASLIALFLLVLGLLAVVGARDNPGT